MCMDLSPNCVIRVCSLSCVQREMQANAMLGFVRYGCRWGWKVGAFASLFTAVRVLFSVYRGSEGVLSYTAAGAVTGAAFKLKYGLKPLIGGAFLGCLIR